MSDQLSVVSNRPDPHHLPGVARRLVFDLIKGRLEDTDLHITFAEDEVNVVWFSYVLGCWKAICTTSLPDGRYYEVTFNKTKNEAYIDTYIKLDNTAVHFTE